MKLIFFGAGFCSKFILESLEGFDEIICTHNLELTSQPFDEKLKIKRVTFSEFSKNSEFSWIFPEICGKFLEISENFSDISQTISENLL